MTIQNAPKALSLRVEEANERRRRLLASYPQGRPSCTGSCLGEEWPVSNRSPRGTYLRIADALRSTISGGTELGSLPTEADLMKEHGVARTTVRRALGVLSAEGLIQSQPGIGWVVVGSEPKTSVFTELSALVQSLGVGADFPSEKHLTETTGAARGTVRRALAQLEGAGVLEVRHGKGRRVRALPSDTS
ncbi:GntR family transcriptional regulator [Kitasatospora purpeofusca]|uniref:GntR family transcriptional regulator n=1 Tax=Kitasatospora purpeofusca TaxID=67352 RepID=UPI00369215FF